MILLLLLFLMAPAIASANSAADFPGAKNTSFAYQNGSALATLSVPKEPNGKLIFYLHPTTGINDNCAPSLVSSNYYFKDDGMRWQLRELLNQGYSILQPDYLGLGAPGSHPFLNLQANTPALSSALWEAFKREQRLSGEYLTIGYSQGASLALETARMSARFPGLLQGTISIAPPSFISSQIKASSLINQPSAVSSLLIYLLRSSSNANLLSPLAKKIEKRGEDMCVLEFSSLLIRSGIPTKDILKPGKWQDPDRQKFLNYLKTTQAKGPLAGRTLILSGDDDRTVFPSLVKLLSRNLKRSGAKIELRELKADHFSITKEGWPLMQDFISQSFQGEPARFYLPLGRYP